MKKPIVIAVASRKGGVGKTTVASALGSLSASQGLKTLLIDLDPQANLIWGLGGEFKNEALTYNLLREQPFELVEVGESECLFGLYGSPQLKEESIQRLDAESLEDVLDELTGFDVVIVDCPPNLDRLEALGLSAADVALLVMDAHPFAQAGALRVLEYIDKRQAKGRSVARKVAVVFNRVDKRRALDRIAQQLTPREDLAHFTIRQDAKLATATALQEEIMQHAPRCNAVEDLKRLWGWIRG